MMQATPFSWQKKPVSAQTDSAEIKLVALALVVFRCLPDHEYIG